MEEKLQLSHNFKKFTLSFFLTIVLVAPVNLNISHNAYTRQQQANFCISYSTILKEGNFQETTAAALLEEGRSYSHQGNYQRALDKYQDSLIVYHAIGNKTREAVLLNDIGLVNYFLGKYDEALECFDIALRVIEGSNDLRDISNRSAFLGNRGLTLIAMGDYKNALIALNEAVTISRELTNNWNIDERSGESVMLGNIATIYERIGQPERAADIYRQAREAAELGVNRTSGANKYELMAFFSAKLNNNIDAINLYNQALAIYQAENNKGMQAVTLVSIGERYQKLEENELALENYENAFSIFVDTDNFMNQADTMFQIGEIFEEIEDHDKALDAYRQSYKTAENIGYIARMGKAANGIGRVDQSLGNYEEALKFYQKALDIYNLEGRLDDQWQILMDIGSIYVALDNLDSGIEYYTTAIEKLEALHSELSVGELRTSLSNRTFLPYAKLIELLWETGQYDDAFEYSERARARVFLNDMVYGNIDFHSNRDTSLIEKESNIKAEIFALRNQLVLLQNRPSVEWDLDTISTVKNELRALETEYTDLLVQIKLQSPEISSLVTVDVASLEEVQNLLSEDTTIVEYFVADNRTYIFIVAKNSFYMLSSDIKRDEIEKNISSFHIFANTSEPHPEELRFLADHLFLPILNYVKTPKVGLVPHGPLHHLPFSALTNDEIYMGEEFIVFNLPSATALRYLNDERRGSTSALVMGNPYLGNQSFSNLYFAEEEARAVAELNNTQAITGSQATESLFMLQASGKGILHIAAHSEYNPYNPLFSVIYLASDEKNDGRLEVQEIYNLDLTQGTTLVILSACETNVGAQYSGDDVVSLTRAFMFAGVPTVISSLWIVEDEATEALMTAFYRHWIVDAMTKSEALQAAQADVRAHSRWISPYYWAGFILSGDSDGYYGSSSSNKPTNPNPLNIPCVSTMLLIIVIYLAGKQYHI